MVKKHESTLSELSKPYEQNVIGFGGIVKFAIGLLLLIIVTFALMLLLNRVLEDNKQQEWNASKNPMVMSDRERLPPEPRLQTAPGFGVDSPNGRVNLELNVPQAEYRELLSGFDLHLVGVMAPLEVLEAREATRADRLPGLAR